MAEMDGPVRPGSERDDDRARLRAELLALGRSLDAPATDGSTMAERVLSQIVAEAVPTPVREPPGLRQRTGAWARRHARILTAALSGLLVVLVLTPPVRAAVVEWFDFGGVQVRYAPSAEPPGPAGASRTPEAGSTGAPDAAEERDAPDCTASVPISEAARQAGFRPVVPRELGPPDAVAVTGLPESRWMVTLCWHERGRTIRLDEFASGLDPYVTKQVRVQPQWLELGTDEEGPGTKALWFAQPHELTFGMVGKDGLRWVRSERTAGPTLLWVRGGQMTLRLEGVDSQERARAVAESTL
ncbi:hypothetical protein ABZS61_30790 [Streptomyces sp. NPDC005566]|uniref:hypothetical protein n=1 Tax=Streptomyces sp. NPDC005566 TaxID=3156886 RepID=UPI0033B43139